MASTIEPTKYSKLLLDNAGNTENSKDYPLTSSSTVLSCEAGSCDVKRRDNDLVLVQLTAGDVDTSDKILDYFQGAVIYATATSAGTTLRIGKHSPQEYK